LPQHGNRFDVNGFGKGRIVNVNVQGREVAALHSDTCAPAVPSGKFQGIGSVASPVREAEPATLELAAWDLASLFYKIVEPRTVRMYDRVVPYYGQKVVAKVLGVSLKMVVVLRRAGRDLLL
jgi:hypothetical protein